MKPWKLEEFSDALDGWRALDNPPAELVARVVEWFLSELAHDPFQPSAAPAGNGFPVTWWFAKLPIWAGNGQRLVCFYEINAEERVLTCRVISQLREPI